MDIRILGISDYQECLRLQKDLHERLVHGDGEECILITQHPSVLTFGKNSDPRFLLLKDLYPTIRTDRGGEITAHNPGQLVMYFILRTSTKLSPRSLVCAIENSVILWLERLKIKAFRLEGAPGIWTDSGKVCAIGLRISSRCSYHGLALNIDNDLDIFKAIVPCGIANKGVCNVFQLLSHQSPGTKLPPIEQIGKEIASIFCREVL